MGLENAQNGCTDGFSPSSTAGPALRFALAAVVILSLSSTLFAAACQSYGEDASGGAGCCPGLVPDFAGKCNQKAGVCDITPESWSFTPLSSTLPAPGSVAGTIQGAESGSGIIGTGSGIYQVGWFNNWQTAGLVGVLLAVFIIAIAAVIGNSFNMPEVKAFVDAELGQAIVSVLLIVSMMGLIAFFDGVARLAILQGGVASSCSGTGEPCYITVARQYLTAYYDSGGRFAEEALRDSVRYQNFANAGRSIQANLWKLGFAGVSYRPNAGLSIEAERKGAIFETMGRLLASIYAQRYFIDVVSYGIAPIMLLLGILLRTFFFTRKLGGLMLAIALALFIIYPLTYALSWYTLKLNLYGDRLAEEHNSCPAECRLQAPAGFYVESDASGDGHLVYFQQESDIVNAGVTRSNWEDGDVDGDGAPDFPGLVACKELINLPAGENPAAPEPPSSCSASCPAYCREVPTPGQYPECQTSACSSCNPGCKVMRQRLDCTRPDVCSSGCTQGCKADLPTENKCYIDQYALPGTDNVVPAELSVQCYGDAGGANPLCTGCPNWCLLRKPDPNNPGQTVPVYNDAACNVDVCRSPAQGGSCPDKCAYVTEVGGDTNCGVLCNGCPLPCRVSSSLDWGKYDTEGFLANYCSNFQAACNSCPNVCRTDIPEDPLYSLDQPPQCAPYPSNPAQPSQCTSCPEYCRFTDYSFITQASNTPREAGTSLPSVCAGSQVKCAAGDCDLNNPGACKAVGTPITCREYDSSNPADAEGCRLCPEQYRVSGQAPPPGYEFVCGSAMCPSQCKAPAGTNPPLCSEYLGYGKQNDFIGCWGREQCWGITGQLPCLSNGCSWGVPQKCFGPSDPCLAAAVEHDQASCQSKSAQGCVWKSPGDAGIPIAYRDIGSQAHSADYYQDTSLCRQCPENCRVGDDPNSCGIADNGQNNDAKVDCTVGACPVACRVDVPSAASGGPAQCKGYIPFETPGFSCPALCRRNPGDSSPASAGGNYCQGAGCQDYNAATGRGLTDLCRFSDAPGIACEQCFDCPLDCVYKPAVRTDCAEVCSEGAEGDSPDIDSGAFLKKLSGASGRTDVMNAGVFMLPALVLPLFNIVIIVAFIRVFSPTLGGDIEIPGLSRIL